MSLIMLPLKEDDHHIPLDISISSEDQEDSSWIDCSEELAVNCFSQFNEVRKSGHLTDVIIKVEGRELPAHRVILSSTIPFFAAMFGSEMAETHSNIITLPNIDADTMESILNFAYSGQLKFTFKNIERLLKAADYFQLTTLSNRCAEIWKTRISEKNVFSIRRFAIMYNIPQAVVDADCYIQRNFCLVSKTSEFAQLDFSTVLHILNWDELHVDTEGRIFEAVCYWLEYDASSRHVFAPKLLTAVRMPLLRPSYIIDVVSRNSLIWNSMECRDLIDEAKNYHLIPERRSQFKTIFKTNIRMCTELSGIIYALGGLNQIHPSPVEYYEPATKRWNIGKPMLSHRTRVGVAVSDGRIYVVGGYNGTERLKSVELFDTFSGNWIRLSPMFKCRSAMCSIALGEHIFVIGGYDGTTALDSVEAFDIKNCCWLTRPSMLAQRCAAGIAISKGLIYVIGGHNGVNIFNTVECYDPVLERWTMVAPMLKPRCRLSATSYKNKIYVVGGYHDGNFLKTAEVYDPETDSWSSIAPMNVSRARVSLVTNGNLLYAIGGYDGENNLNSMEIYNPNKNQWEFGTSMISHEGGVGAVVVPTMPRINNTNQTNNSGIKRPYNFDDFNDDSGGSGPSNLRRMSEQIE